MEELRVPIKGMACGACAAKVEGSLKSMPGVSSVKVNLKAEEAKVTIDPSITSEKRVRQRILQTGFHAGECSQTAHQLGRKRGLLSKLRHRR